MTLDVLKYVILIKNRRAGAGFLREHLPNVAMHFVSVFFADGHEFEQLNTKNY